jgi:HK97 gp10 family phage protein
MRGGNITGIEELTRMLEAGKKAPARVLTTASKKGANIVKDTAKNLSPVNTGALKRGIRLKAEKSKTGKKVYRILVMGEKFVKISLAGKRSFYPASQEYGWRTTRGKVPPKNYMKQALQQNRQMIEQTIINELTNSLKALGW